MDVLRHWNPDEEPRDRIRREAALENSADPLHAWALSIEVERLAEINRIARNALRGSVSRGHALDHIAKLTDTGGAV